jgi:predicted nucleic acid-binding protein
MSAYFYDSSAISKHYHLEKGTDVVDGFLRAPNSQHYISRLTIIEIHSVFARKVRMRDITEIDFVRLLRLLRADIGRSLLGVVRFVDAHYNEAERLLRSHSLHRGLRTLDALQLSVAVTLARHGGLDHFVCADTRLADAAVAEGLSVLNPEAP